jgi:hypothetical protein
MKKNLKLSERSKKAVALYAEALDGNRKAQYLVSESIAIGDFAKPMEPILAAQIVKVYHETESNVELYTTPKTTQGINRKEPVSAIVISDADQSNIPETNMGDRWVPGTLPTVGPREKYPEIGLAPYNEKTISTSQIGEAFAVDWQAIVNSRGGEINLLDQAVTAFGKHAKQSQDVFALKNLVNAQGFTTKVTGAGGGRVIPGNPDFSNIETFVDALEDVRETPIVIDGNEQVYDSYVLLCAPGMKAKYDRMLNARAFTRIPARTGDDSEAPSLQYQLDVVVPVTVTVVETKWIRQLWPNIGRGYIMLPTQGDNEYPVLTLNKLAGYPEPSFWVKDSNAREYRGGEVDVQANGDFDSDAIETKVRHVLGSDLLWGDGILYSTGQNTA